jgi:hypothetical protein
MSNRENCGEFWYYFSKKGLKYIEAYQYDMYGEEGEWAIATPDGPVCCSPWGYMTAGGGTFGCPQKWVHQITKDVFIRKGWYRVLRVAE